MKSFAKIVTVHRKTSGLFAAINAAVLRDGHKHIGSSIGGKRTIMLKSEELASYMPSVLGVVPTSLEYLPKLNDYFDDMAIYVPETGLSLEVGMYFDMNNPVKQEAIKALITKSKAKNEEIKSNEDLGEYVYANLPVDDHWKYGTPIDANAYAIWRYTAGYKAVANDTESINASKDINFYIHDESQVKAAKIRTSKLRRKINKLFLDIVDDIKKVDDVLLATNKVSSLSGYTEEEKQLMLEELKDTDGEKFYNFASNDKVNELAYVERLIAYQLLERDASTGYITEVRSGDVLGKDGKQVIHFLAQTDNAKLSNELRGKLKELSNK